MVDAPAYDAAFEANEVAAHDKFDGHPILMHGLCDGVMQGLMDDISVQFLSGKEWGHVTAQIVPEERRKAAALKKGERVTVLCAQPGRKLINATANGCRITADFVGLRPSVLESLRSRAEGLGLDVKAVEAALVIFAGNALEVRRSRGRFWKDLKSSGTEVLDRFMSTLSTQDMLGTALSALTIISPKNRLRAAKVAFGSGAAIVLKLATSAPTELKQILGNWLVMP